jgi:hypothetical protein
MPSGPDQHPDLSPSSFSLEAKCGPRAALNETGRSEPGDLVKWPCSRCSGRQAGPIAIDSAAGDDELHLFSWWLRFADFPVR